MYYEEKIINGVLYSRTSPLVDFEPISQEALTSKISSLRAKNTQLVKELNALKENITNSWRETTSDPPNVTITP